jgi:hypothetical protein
MAAVPRGSPRSHASSLTPPTLGIVRAVTPLQMSPAPKLSLDFTGKFESGKLQAKANLTIGRKPTGN